MILPIAVVTIQGANADLAADLANANTVWAGECGVFVDVVATSTVNNPNLLVLDQTDCLASGHVVSTEEDDLFDLGRNTGADVTVYYLSGDVAGFRGCAAHPPGRRGCWVGDSATDWTFIHELTHIVGDNGHQPGNTDNLMFNSTSGITNLPPDLTKEQCLRILADPALLDIPSIVLNL
ncbi:MAG: hypothetical protein O6951_06990 [Actinobacteria bacterium]|nr:hypothetical protein [Actinomycetota bacterium]